jgi:hypothetical protein
MMQKLRKLQIYKNGKNVSEYIDILYVPYFCTDEKTYTNACSLTFEKLNAEILNSTHVLSLKTRHLS